eukprot:jgi/Chrpa1/21335/Chrysochromulina_OHIO_Genome00004305-RA
MHEWLKRAMVANTAACTGTSSPSLPLPAAGWKQSRCSRWNAFDAQMPGAVFLSMPSPVASVAGAVVGAAVGGGSSFPSVPI